MSDPLQPWIEKYLRGIAETHGGDLVPLKWCDKSEKGQVIRLLTDAQKDAIFWGMLSDGEYSVPLKILKDAVVEDRQLHDSALSENSIISVQKFKVASTRVPLGNNSGLGKTPRIVIECAAFGRSARNVHTKILGSPKLITSHEDFKLWEEGLDKGGGAGNVLRLRKEAASTASLKATITPPPPIIVEEEKILQRRVSRARANPELTAELIQPTSATDPLPWKEYWQTGQPRGGPDFVSLAHLVQPHPKQKPELARPEGQELTPRVVPTTPTRAASATPMASSSPEVFVEGWDLTPPRTRTKTHLPSPSTDQPSPPLAPRISASQLLLSDTDLPEPEMDDDAPMPQDETLSSSIPKPSQPTLDEDKMDLDPQRPISYEQPYPAESRKVPRPPTPKRLPSTDKGGPGIVLVPNSDVSMTGSSQPQEEAPPAKVLRKALSQLDVNSQSQESVPEHTSKSRQPAPSRGTKRSGVYLSQEYDGDEESMEKLGVTRDGKKSRRSVSQGTARTGRRADRFSEYPWPIVSAKEVLQILAETEERRRGRN